MLLPQLCAGAVLQGGHAKEHIVSKTGWLMFDIDDDHNPSISDWPDVREFVAQIPHVAFSGLSVSGNGVWGLIHIAQPDKQKEHFEQLKADFQDCGIILDTTKGKNPNDKRAYSYDPDAYIAEEFQVYDRLPESRIVFKKSPPPSSASKTRKQVEEKLCQIERYSIPLAPDYPTYRDIGFAIASEFGEAGRDYFHRAVKHHHKYDKNHADHQYTKCLTPGPIGIGTFFHICKQHNI
ncbi:MAG: hypothetical protein CL670_00665 [Balneola sp.]|jgi:hypothetical protein|nr:hypothetical protein [Balneola sp.]MBE77645.1 hypothetical protein [Balneola sp.]|tara:strand:+ start:17108 stop:17815 length:708 start_codon:yes stop_codon:yes gene_type:complete